MKKLEEYYDWWYFRCYHRYHEKKRALQKAYGEIIECAEVSRGGLALDVGCAYGFIVELLNRLGYDAYGIDVSKHACRVAKRNGQDVVLCSGEYLPFRDSVFLLVTSFEVLEHFPSAYKGVKEIFRVLKGDGVFVGSTPNKSLSPLVHLVGGLYRIFRSGALKFKYFREVFHVCQVSVMDNVEQLFRKVGMRKVKTWKVFLLPIPPVFFGRYFYVPLPFFATHVRIVAEKNGCSMVC